MTIREPSSEKITRFDGGLDMETPVTSLARSNALDCDNVVVFGKTVMTRAGSTLHRDYSVAARAHSIYEFVKLSTGERFQIAGVGTDLYSGATKIGTGLSGNPLTFDVLNNTLLICDGASKIKKWTGSGSIAEVSASPVCASILVVNSCVVALGISGAKNTYMWSDVQNFDSWPVSRQDTLIDNDTTGLVVGMKTYNQLGLWKRESIHLVDGFPIPTNTMKLPGNNGCASMKTLKDTPRGPIWLSLTGVYGLFDGVVTLLSEKLGPYFDLTNPLYTPLNPSRLQHAHAEVVGDHYYLSFSTGTNDHENQGVVLNLKNLAWTTWKNQDSAALGAYTDSDLVQRLFRGTVDGKVLKINMGGNDCGAAYRSYWRTPPIRFSRKVALFEVAITIANMGAWPIQITYTLDQGTYSSPVFQGVPIGGSAIFDVSKFDSATYNENGAITIRKRIGGECREVSFLISTDGPDQPWQLFELEVSYIPSSR